MPSKDSTTHTPKQKRQAKHIQESYAKRGVPAKRRKAIAWATVNKEESGGGRGKSRTSGRGSAKSRSATTRDGTRNSARRDSSAGSGTRASASRTSKAGKR